MHLCDHIGSLAIAYFDDELSDQELRDLELHLFECASCRARVDQERATVGEMRRRLAPPPMPSAMRTRIMGRLRRARPRISLGVWFLPGFATAVAVIALGLAFCDAV